MNGRRRWREAWRGPVWAWSVASTCARGAATNGEKELPEMVSARVESETAQEAHGEAGEKLGDDLCECGQRRARALAARHERREAAAETRNVMSARVASGTARKGLNGDDGEKRLGLAGLYPMLGDEGE